MTDPFISSDASDIHFPRMDLTDAVKGSRRAQLEALRDYVANELEVNRCNSCTASKLRTGDQASLILRLQTILGELDALPAEDEEETGLERIKRGLFSVPNTGRPAAPPVVPPTDPSSQRRTGSRRPREAGGA